MHGPNNEQSQAESCEPWGTWIVMPLVPKQVADSPEAKVAWTLGRFSALLVFYQRMR
jgi:hypothetical protein